MLADKWVSGTSCSILRLEDALFSGLREDTPFDPREVEFSSPWMDARKISEPRKFSLCGKPPSSMLSNLQREMSRLSSESK